MSAIALVSGKLWKDPEGRTSKSGKAFVTAILREGTGDAATWWNVIAFEDTASELLRLKDGDGVAISGTFSVERYENGGQTRISFKIVVDRLAAPRLSRRKSAT